MKIKSCMWSNGIEKVYVDYNDFVVPCLPTRIDYYDENIKKYIYFNGAESQILREPLDLDLWQIKVENLILIIINFTFFLSFYFVLRL